MLQAELSVDAALMLPDDFDVALMRDWLGLKRSLTDCSWPVAPRPESASRSGCSTGTRSDAVASLCFTLF